MPRLIDETGHRYGKWTVLKRDNTKQRGYWICQCDCGTIKSIYGSELRKGRTKSCGCAQKIDDIGKRFGKLMVLKKDENNSQKYICQCNCGKNLSVYKNHLRTGKTKSCGSSQCKETKLRNNLSGQKFGLLTVIEPSQTQTWNDRVTNGVKYTCKCECGTIKDIYGNHLIANDTISCGCISFSKGEEKIKTLLNQANIPYIQEYAPKLFYNNSKRSLRFDFYVNNKYIIEFDGRQHYKSNTWARTPMDLQKIKNKDQFKNQYCFDNNIPIIRIPYWHYNNLIIEDLLLETSTFIIGGDANEVCHDQTA